MRGCQLFLDITGKKKPRKAGEQTGAAYQRGGGTLFPMRSPVWSERSIPRQAPKGGIPNTVNCFSLVCNRPLIYILAYSDCVVNPFLTFFYLCILSVPSSLRFLDSINSLTVVPLCLDDQLHRLHPIHLTLKQEFG